MKFLVAFACLLAVAAAKPGYIASPYAYSYSPVHANGFSYASYSAAAPLAYAAAPAVVPAVAPFHHATAFAPAVAPVVPAVAAYAAYAAPVVPAVEKTQYHAQDVLGQASYGHTEAFQQHHATQDAAGNKAGSYSYVAPDGQVIAANYVADSLGYRVASNALPVGPTHVAAPVQETPEVAAARAAHYAAHAEAKHRSRRAIVSPFGYTATPYAHTAAYTTPYAHSAAYATPYAHSAAYTTPYAHSAAYTTPYAYSSAYTTPFAYSAYGSQYHY